MPVALALDLTIPERAQQAHAARVAIEECYLVDPSSSHMVVSKIKLCLCVHRSSHPFCRRCAPGLNWLGYASGAFAVNKLEGSKQSYALYTNSIDAVGMGPSPNPIYPKQMLLANDCRARFGNDRARTGAPGSCGACGH
uniref:Uncharacterized protein n=1 Tax=Solanum tuberosum TaxID=4113 RepID=M1DUF3_SOLTU